MPRIKKEKTVFQELKEECEGNGFSMRGICLASGTNPMVVQRWKNSDPKSIRIYKKLKAEIEKRKKA